MKDLKILCLQTDIAWKDPSKNRELLEIKIINHVDDHRLILLPETFTTGFPAFPDFMSEKRTGKTIEWMAGIAQKTGAVLAGTILLEENGNFTNSLIWMHPDGHWEHYAKRHVFTMANENKVITRGNKQLVVELDGWKICPMVCYDLRFPVWSKNRYNEDGNYTYDLALYLANWPAIRAYPWSQLLIARAIENLAYVAGVNRVGHDPNGIYYSGDSMIIDPKGKILSTGDEGKERVLSETLSAAELRAFREKFDVGLDWDQFSLHVE